MPFSIKVDKGSNLLLTHWSGPFSSKDSANYRQKLSKLNPEEQLLPRLHDGREVTFDVSVDDIYKSRNIGYISDQAPILRSAILVRSDLAYGMMRIFKAVYNHPELDIQLFHDLEEAKDWLGVKLQGDPFEQMHQ